MGISLTGNPVYHRERCRCRPGRAGQIDGRTVDMHVGWANRRSAGIHDEVMIVLLKRPKAESKPWRSTAHVFGNETGEEVSSLTRGNSPVRLREFATCTVTTCGESLRAGCSNPQPTCTTCATFSDTPTSPRHRLTSPARRCASHALQFSSTPEPPSNETETPPVSHTVRTNDNGQLGERGGNSLHLLRKLVGMAKFELPALDPSQVRYRLHQIPIVVFRVLCVRALRFAVVYSSFPPWSELVALEGSTPLSAHRDVNRTFGADASASATRPGTSPPSLAGSSAPRATASACRAGSASRGSRSPRTASTGPATSAALATRSAASSPSAAGCR